LTIYFSLANGRYTNCLIIQNDQFCSYLLHYLHFQEVILCRFYLKLTRTYGIIVLIVLSYVHGYNKNEQFADYWDKWNDFNVLMFNVATFSV
jgi:hypothetical protein